MSIPASNGAATPSSRQPNVETNRRGRLYKPGERFEFGLTLFGRALQFLPYFVLAVPEMGRLGVGPGRGSSPSGAYGPQIHSLASGSA